MPPATAIEKRVWHAFADGALVDVRPRRRAPDDLRHGAEWGPERRVRAEFLVDLLTGCDAPEPQGVSALRLSGVAVVGELRLEAAQVPYLVELTECWFSHAPDVRMARFAGLRLPGCRVPGLRGRNLVVESDLVLEAGFTSHGLVDLSDAQVDGSLRLTAAVLRAPARRTSPPGAARPGPSGAGAARSGSRPAASRTARLASLVTSRLPSAHRHDVRHGPVSIDGDNDGVPPEPTPAAPTNDDVDASAPPATTPTPDPATPANAPEPSDGDRAARAPDRRPSDGDRATPATGRLPSAGDRAAPATGRLPSAGDRATPAPDRRPSAGDSDPDDTDPDDDTAPTPATEPLRGEIGTAGAVGPVGTPRRADGGGTDPTTVAPPSGGSTRERPRDAARDAGAALVAERAIIGGAVQASILRAVGAVRIPNSRIGGNVELAGARLSNPPGDALHAVGIEVSGSIAGDLVADGRVVLAGARLGGDLRLSGARLTVATPDHLPGVVTPRGVIDDTGASLVADRVDVRGNVELDDGFTAAGVVRLPAASIGGYLRLSGSRLGDPGRPPAQFPVALIADGARIGGDLDARAARGAEDDDGRHGPLVAHGQVRLVDAAVRGSASLSGVKLHGAGLDVLFADRLHVGGTLFLRAARIHGSIRLQNADIGSTLDCTGAVVTEPRVRPDGTSKPSLDARVAAVGKDVLCSRGFVATGGVRLRRAEVGKSVNFEQATLGGAPRTVALNAFGLHTQELNVRFAEPPVGDVLLTRADTVSVADSEHLWRTRGRVDIEDFTYQALAADPDVDVRTRLRWLGLVVTEYDPDPYEQLATMYADAGREERSRRVLLANQRRRHAAMRLPGRVLGWLQEVTVGYGYRPMLTVLWFLGAWAAGSWWFTTHYVPVRIDPENQPLFNGVLFALDTLLPIVNIGQDQHWQVGGASQWVAAVLTLVGWVLASTAAAGATRVLKRG